MNSKDQKQISQAQDGFKKWCSDNGGSCKSDSLFSGKTTHGKGDVPRNLSKRFRDNYDDIFPNSFKPSWQSSKNT